MHTKMNLNICLSSFCVNSSPVESQQHANEFQLNSEEAIKIWMHLECVAKYLKFSISFFLTQKPPCTSSSFNLNTIQIIVCYYKESDF